MSVHGQLLLRNHTPFIRFWLARVFTASGFQMLTVAIGWHLYQLTGNVLDLGLVGLVEFAPRVLFMLHTGHVADRYDRRKVAALCQSLQGLIALALALGSATDNVTRELWRHLQQWQRDPASARRAWLTYGDRDRLRYAIPAFAPLLPPSQVLEVDGGHAWRVWTPAAEQVLERIDASRRDGAAR